MVQTAAHGGGGTHGARARVPGRGGRRVSSSSLRIPAPFERVHAAGVIVVIVRRRFFIQFCMLLT